jgi:hypothetical protein
MLGTVSDKAFIKKKISRLKTKNFW